MRVQRWSVSESQESRDHLSTINILDMGSQCTKTPLTDCATCPSTLSLWLDQGSCAPLSPFLLVRGRLRLSSHTGECHCLGPRHSKRENKHGASSYKASLGSKPAVDGGRKREGGYWSISRSFSSTGRDIHPSFVGRRESVRYQCFNVISLALSRAPECHTGSEAKWATTGWEREREREREREKQEVHT